MWQAHVSVRRTLELAVTALGFVMLGAWLTTFGETGPMIAGVTGIVFFGGGMAVILLRLRRTGPAIEVSPGGVCWRQWSDRTIPWDAVRHARVRRVHRQPFLCLWLRDPATWRGRTTAIGANLSASMGFGDVALTAVGTDRSFGELLAAVARHIPID